MFDLVCQVRYKDILMRYLILSIAAGLIFGVAVVMAQTPNQVTIKILPAAASLPPDQVLEVRLDSGAAGVGFARIEIDFDQTKVQMVDEATTSGVLRTVMSQTVKDEANSSGRIVVVLGLATADRDNPPTGEFEVFRVQMKSISGAVNDTTEVGVNTEGSQVVTIDGAEAGLTGVGATLNLNPTVGAKLEFAGAGTVPILGEWRADVNLDTPEAVTGVDAVVRFDPGFLEIKSVDQVNLLGGETKQESGVTPGVVRFSQTAVPGGGFLGKGKLATVVFKAKVVGKTEIGLDFELGSKSESNVISNASGQDILVQPDKLGVEITGAGYIILEIDTPSEKNPPGDSVTGSLARTSGGTYQFTTDAAGGSGQIELNPADLGLAADWTVKVPGFLRERFSLTAGAGENVVNVGMLRAGDLNDDGIVNNIDLSLMYDQWFGAGGADYNRDGIVNSADHWHLASRFFAEDE